MPWRLLDEEGSLDSHGGIHVFHRYAAVCPECGRLTGWPTKDRATRDLAILVDNGVEGLAVAEYTRGDDDSCPGH